MSALSENLASIVRGLASDPLAGFKHESVVVPEWEGARVIIRAPSAGDHLFHIRAIWAAAGVNPGEGEDIVRAKLDAPGVDYTRASASLLVRTLFEQTEAGPTRVFSDHDVDLVVAAFGNVHARLVAKAIELGNLGEGAQERAKKPSAKRRTYVS
ncbi:phage tail assembly chaperone [Achromobacter xylosoxidans]